MMMPEIWTVIAAVLLGLAAVVGSLALFAPRGRWEAVAIGSRIAALAALIVALIAAASAQGYWSPGDSRQAMLSLVAAILLVHLALAWQLGAGTAGPVVDLLALALSLLTLFVIETSPPEPACVQLPVLYQAHWVLFSIGGGCVMVAASSGLMLLLRRGVVSRGWDRQLPGWPTLYGLLAHAAVLALVVLGSGLVVGVWWVWRISGTLAWDSAREAWMAIAWLIAAMSLLAWQLDGRRSRWAAGLALLAAIAVLVGLISPADLRMVGI